MNKPFFFKLTRAKPEDIERIGELEATVYSGNDVIPIGILTDWYISNPNIFWVIVTGRQKVVGHIDVLPVKPERLNELLEGVITEGEIKGSDLYPPSDKESIESLYIESLAIVMPERLTRAKVLLSILTDFKTIAECICNPEKVRNIYAISASPEGSSILRHLGFQILKKANERKDHHDLFSASFHDLVNKIKDLAC